VEVVFFEKLLSLTISKPESIFLGMLVSS